MLAIKGKFKTISSPFYGIFIIYLDDDSGAINNISVIVSRDNSIYKTDPIAETVLGFESKISDASSSGNYMQSISSALLENLKAVDSSFAEKIFSAVQKGDIEKYENIIKNAIYSSLTDEPSDLELFAYVEVISAEDLEAAEEEEFDVGDMNTPDGIAVNVFLQLSAVRGKLIYDLKVGEKIMVKIDPKSSQGDYFIDNMNLREGSKVLPTPGEIISISKTEEGYYEVLVKLSDGLFGKVLEEEPVKVRVYNPGLDNISKNLRIEKEETPIEKKPDKTSGMAVPESSSSSSSFTFIMIGLVILLSILVYFVINMI